MNTLGNMDTILDVLIILIPLLIALFLVFKFVFPKKPLLGIGLALGGGLLGAFFIRRRLQKAFDAEDEIARHNTMMAEFKKKQKQRSQVIAANEEVIKYLKKQKNKLEKKGDKFEIQKKQIDKELKDRQRLNEKILSDSDEFLNSLKTKDAARMDLLKQLEDEQAMQTDFSQEGGPTQEAIEVNGYRLIKW